ncbi:MAG: hypothetical protein QOH93_697 [Chloroflexia bacterium]|jgi:hypothetical protein|nr:hypothetical protein [Chloroflexia bacterium]
MNSYDINIVEINVAFENLKKHQSKSKKEITTMSTNYYMLEQVANGINSDRRTDANAYRLWRKALQSLQGLRHGKQQTGDHAR